MKLRFRPKFLDIATFLAGAAIVALVSIAIYSGSSDSVSLRITGDSGDWIESLDQTADLQVKGPLGTTVIHVEKGVARIIDSPCKNKLCIAMGAISKNRQWVACLPNNVFVRIQGGSGKDGIDAATF
jgi:hypothetical protein